VLEGVVVAVDAAGAPEFGETATLVALPAMPLHAAGSCYTLLERPGGALAAGKLAATLRFTVKEIDPASGEAEEEGYEDEYQVCGGLCVCVCACVIVCVYARAFALPSAP
jgi:coatomer protein complex subunit gamma